MTNASLYLVLSNVPAERAPAIARTLVAEKLAACANLGAPVTSIYLWRGETCEAAEIPMTCKVASDRYDAFEARLVELHPYEVPEIIALRASCVLPAYLAWALGDA